MQFTCHPMFITLPPIGQQNIVMTVPVCLSVHKHMSGNTRPNFIKFFVHVTYGRGSVSSGSVVICHVLQILWIP